MKRKKLNAKESQELMQAGIITGGQEINAILKKYGLKIVVQHTIKIVPNIVFKDKK